MRILVTGGAGYIGSVAVSRLILLGHEVTVVDNLSKGKIELVDKKAKFFKCDILNIQDLEKVFSLGFDCVMHFAALKDAGESMKNPSKYCENITGTINLLSLMDKYKVPKIIFSSSAAVYGNPVYDVIDEIHSTDPINFYGFTKLECERIINWFYKIKGIEYVSLRYFNVAGDCLGYIDPDAKNVFPILAEVASGKRDFFEIFGNDYPTLDGTCIRDYIHVIDLVDAHIKALDLHGGYIINLGSEKGHSVLELVKAFESELGRKIKTKIATRRQGDPISLIASSAKAFELLGWKPKFTLKDMVKSTLEAYK